MQNRITSQPIICTSVGDGQPGLTVHGLVHAEYDDHLTALTNRTVAASVTVFLSAYGQTTSTAVMELADVESAIAALERARDHLRAVKAGDADES